DNAATGRMRQMADYFRLKMRDERGRVGVTHLHQTDDNGLARLQQQVKKLRRHLVVVAFIGGDVDKDVREGSRLHQARNVTACRPRRHIRAVPNDEILEQIEARRIDGNTTDLINVLIETGRTWLRQQM